MFFHGTTDHLWSHCLSTAYPTEQCQNRSRHQCHSSKVCFRSKIILGSHQLLLQIYTQLQHHSISPQTTDERRCHVLLDWRTCHRISHPQASFHQPPSCSTLPSRRQHKGRHRRIPLDGWSSPFTWAAWQFLSLNSLREQIIDGDWTETCTDREGAISHCFLLWTFLHVPIRQIIRIGNRPSSPRTHLQAES